MSARVATVVVPKPEFADLLAENARLQQQLEQIREWAEDDGAAEFGSFEAQRAILAILNQEGKP